MNSYYNITKVLKDYLMSNAGVNTVVIGNISDIDIQKQTLYPLAQIVLDGGSFANNTIRFAVTVMVMDSVLVSNEDPLLLNDIYEGLDNKQDVYNSTLAVLNGLQTNLKRGKLYQDQTMLEGEPTLTAFEDSFGNLLTGWRMDFNIIVPNVTISTCSEYLVGSARPDTKIYTWDTGLVTFDKG